MPLFNTERWTAWRYIPPHLGHGGNAQKTKTTTTSKQKTNKNKAMRTLKTCGPKDRLPSTAAYKPWANMGGHINGRAYKFRNEPQQC